MTRSIDDSIQAPYRAPLRAALALSIDHFGARLLSVYLSGSVALGEAWPGASDVDAFLFIDALGADDSAWCREQGEALEARYPVIDGFHLSAHGLDRLMAEPFWRFILGHNARRLHGRDLLAELAAQGVEIPAPTPGLARSRLGWMRANLEGALAGQIPEALFPNLPADPRLVTRKLARNFVVLEGAHLLMAEGEFVGFRSDAVLRRLSQRHGEWDAVVCLTRRVLADPLRAGVEPAAFMEAIADFGRWTLSRIEACSGSEGA